MKIVFALLVIIFLLASGCTSAPQQSYLDVSVTPSTRDLVGNWTGPMTGYDEGTGFTDYNSVPMTLVIAEQQGRIFTGYIALNLDNAPSRVPVAGVIGREGKTFSFLEKGYGYATGEIIGPDEIELTWLHDGSPYGVAIDSLRRI